MLTVQQLFQRVDAEQFIQEFLKYNATDYLSKIFNINNPADINSSYYENLISTLKNTLNLFKTMEVTENKDNIIFVVPFAEDDYFVYESYFLQKEDIINNNENYDRYAYELDEYSQVLGYGVSEATLYLLGEVQTAVGIFNEMTFCGINVTERDLYVSDITTSLQEALKEIEDKGVETLLPAEDVFKEFNFTDDRTQCEKDFDQAKFDLQIQIKKLKQDFLFEQERKFIENSSAINT